MKSGNGNGTWVPSTRQIYSEASLEISVISGVVLIGMVGSFSLKAAMTEFFSMAHFGGKMIVIGAPILKE